MAVNTNEKQQEKGGKQLEVVMKVDIRVVGGYQGGRWKGKDRGRGKGRKGSTYNALRM